MGRRKIWKTEKVTSYKDMLPAKRQEKEPTSRKQCLHFPFHAVEAQSL